MNNGKTRLRNNLLPTVSLKFNLKDRSTEREKNSIGEEITTEKIFIVNDCLIVKSSTQDTGIGFQERFNGIQVLIPSRSYFNNNEVTGEDSANPYDLNLIGSTLQIDLGQITRKFIVREQSELLGLENFPLAFHWGMTLVCESIIN